jgi:hypothetical protein
MARTNAILINEVAATMRNGIDAMTAVTPSPGSEKSAFGSEAVGRIKDQVDNAVAQLITEPLFGNQQKASILVRPQDP